MSARDEKEAVHPDVGVVIVAAGSGSRAAGTTGELKQFRWVGDKPMLLHTVHAFQKRADVALVVCVLPRSHAADPPPWLFQCDLDRLLVSTGGAYRGRSSPTPRSPPSLPRRGGAAGPWPRCRSSTR